MGINLSQEQRFFVNYNIGVRSKAVRIWYFRENGKVRGWKTTLRSSSTIKRALFLPKQRFPYVFSLVLCDFLSQITWSSPSPLFFSSFFLLIMGKFLR